MITPVSLPRTVTRNAWPASAALMMSAVLWRSSRIPTVSLIDPLYHNCVTLVIQRVLAPAALYGAPLPTDDEKAVAFRTDRAADHLAVGATKSAGGFTQTQRSRTTFGS